MSDYTISWTNSIGDTEEEHTVSAPTREEALKMYATLANAKVCSCGPDGQCDMCPPHDAPRTTATQGI